MTRYSEEQIRDAIKRAAAKNTPGPVYAWELSMYKKVIDALPEPQDDWQECTFRQVSEHDLKVKVVWGDFAMEGEISAVDEGAIYIADRGVVDIGGDWKKIYRIPAPVVAPDPEQHPVIYVKDCNIVGFIPKIMVWYRDSYVAGQQCLSPERITDWQQIDPAKVVADDE